MCLERAKRFVATEDIKCYKLIRSVPDRYYLLGCHGKSFTGIVNHTPCDGIISVSDRGGVFFCTNYSFIDGCDTENKFGYKYSWAIDSTVSDIVVEGEKIPQYFITVYRRVEVRIGETYLSGLYCDLEGNVHEGLHSYVKYPKDTRNKIMVECLIPKGSVVYKGDFDGEKSYASDTLKYVKIIDNKS